MMVCSELGVKALGCQLPSVNQRALNTVFSVNSYILVLRLGSYLDTGEQLREVSSGRWVASLLCQDEPGQGHAIGVDRLVGHVGKIDSPAYYLFVIDEVSGKI